MIDFNEKVQEELSPHKLRKPIDNILKLILLDADSSMKILIDIQERIIGKLNP